MPRHDAERGLRDGALLGLTRERDQQAGVARGADACGEYEVITSEFAVLAQACCRAAEERVEPVEVGENRGKVLPKEVAATNV
jgi:hypothetical protein